MAALLMLSPRLLDHSFPRDLRELRLAAVSAAKVKDYCVGGRGHVLVTDAFASMVQQYSWSGVSRGDLLAMVYEFHARLATHPGFAHHLDLRPIAHDPYPLPCGLASSGLSGSWADEAGSIAAWHMRLIPAPDACIGVVCDEAFGTGESPCPHDGILPLVGPAEAESLSDAFEPNPEPVGQVRFESARRNIALLDGKITAGMESSHIKVTLPGGAFWVLDSNHDPVPDRELQQLAFKLGRSLAYVKHVLSTGRRPPDRFRLQAAVA